MTKRLLIKIVIVFAVFGSIFIYREQIANFLLNTFIYNRDIDITVERNEFSRHSLNKDLSADFEFVQITDDFVARDFSHLLNIFYTMLDGGEIEFYFYCSESYSECQNDIFGKVLNKDNGNYLSYINNFVHPFNSYSSVNVIANNFGRITVQITKQYSSEQIEFVLNEINLIKEKLITVDMGDREKIKLFHDYIINLVDYDKDRAQDMNDPRFRDSYTHTAYGLFKERLALCGGFSETMAIFLHSIGINNYLITGVAHVWNLIYIGEEWLHIDVTWNNPLTTSGEKFLLHDWFLITTQRLMELVIDEADEHSFNPNIFIEALKNS